MSIQGTIGIQVCYDEVKNEEMFSYKFNTQDAKIHPLCRNVKKFQLDE